MFELALHSLTSGGPPSSVIGNSLHQPTLIVFKLVFIRSLFFTPAPSHFADLLNKYGFNWGRVGFLCRRKSIRTFLSPRTYNLASYSYPPVFIRSGLFRLIGKSPFLSDLYVPLNPKCNEAMSVYYHRDLWYGTTRN